ncbi:hypothetical protein [Terrimonas pollutisoli]|uniref:hypothetical protein n=1 Tax=Terrimonas pollutisoli TaxID=3034147 RepID=UPI0023EBC59B|nr:hypothetical protein [Terrimonas sp. H1YJ31]
MENPKPMQVNKLNDVVDRLINTLLPKASSNRSFFVNDIPHHLRLKKESPVITSVLGGLLSTIVSNAKDSCIWLSAKLYGNVVLVHVKTPTVLILMLSRASFSNCRHLLKKTGALLASQGTKVPSRH